ncbi:V-type proton ATPase subunit S1-like [Homarus americanus]|uniref:V-type proton ATPase subunit S1-like n=1 Tax=Homarus americanus TaxID=6706 RepID=UPI001C46F08A|nr:V-type proton ATPase subunit S1-like [Homarus americanus]
MEGKVVTVILLSSIICGVYAKEHVPVLIWNTQQSQEGLPAVSALQFMNYGTFQAKYLEPFKPKNILLFLQDALSVEDLSSHASELHHVSQWMESSHSLYLPNVEEAAHLAHDLPSHGYNVVVLEPGVPSAGLNLKQQDKNLVVVKLPSTLTNPSRRRAIQKADEVMENVISKIGAQREFTVIFTGLKPSVEEHSEQYEERIRVARSLQAVSAGLPGYYNTSCVLLYLHNNTVVTLTHQNSTDSEVLVVDEGQSMGEAIGHCPGTADDKTANILIKYQNVESNKNHTYGKVKFQLNFEMANKGWTLTGVNGSFDTTEIYFKPISSEISGIPIFMSYACTQKVTFTAAVNNNTGSSNGLVKLVLGGVQMHPFTVKGKFGGAWDCVGFFTVSIWISLLATLLMVTILSVGMYMLSDIKTMDRFDDPKGQPIMVPNTD